MSGTVRRRGRPAKPKPKKRGHSLKIATLAIFQREPRQMTIGNDHSTVQDLFNFCDESIPTGSEVRVNQRVASPTTKLKNGDVVTAYPSVSGGGIPPAPFFMHDYTGNGNIPNYIEFTNLLANYKLPKGFKRINFLSPADSINPPSSKFEPDQIYVLCRSRPYRHGGNGTRTMKVLHLNPDTRINFENDVTLETFDANAFKNFNPHHIKCRENTIATITYNIIHLHMGLIHFQTANRPTEILKFVLEEAKQYLIKSKQIITLKYLSDSLTDMLNRSTGEKINEKKRLIDSENGVLRSYKSEFMKRTKGVMRVEAEVKALNELILTHVDGKAVMKKIKNIRGIEKMRVFRDRFEVFTNQMTITHREKGILRKRYKIGKFLLVFYYTGEYLIKNLSKPDSMVYDHPYIRNGLACWGNMKDIETSIINGHIDIAIQGIIHFLEGYAEESSPHVSLPEFLKLMKVK